MMRPIWKSLPVLLVALPMAAYVAGTLNAARHEPKPYEVIVLRPANDEGSEAGPSGTTVVVPEPARIEDRPDTIKRDDDAVDDRADDAEDAQGFPENRGKDETDDPADRTDENPEPGADETDDRPEDSSDRDEPADEEDTSGSGGGSGDDEGDDRPDDSPTDATEAPGG
ncbi:MAG: hypothetical protein ACRCYQ_12965 [Nocardioides sp.]